MAMGTQKSTPETLGHKVGEEAKKGMEKAKNIGDKVTDQVKGAASTVAQKTESAAGFLGDKAEQATEAVSSGMRSLGDTIREHTPDSGMLKTAGAAVADTLESGGRYLEEHKLREIGDDVTNMIRRNPLPAVLIAAGLGFVLARAMRS